MEVPEELGVIPKFPLGEIDLLPVSNCAFPEKEKQTIAKMERKYFIHQIYSFKQISILIKT